MVRFVSPGPRCAGAEALCAENHGSKYGKDRDHGGKPDGARARLPSVRSSRPALSSMTTKLRRHSDCYRPERPVAGRGSHPLELRRLFTAYNILTLRADQGIRCPQAGGRGFQAVILLPARLSQAPISLGVCSASCDNGPVTYIVDHAQRKELCPTLPRYRRDQGTHRALFACRAALLFHLVQLQSSDH